jgi:hypothetical protein
MITWATTCEQGKIQGSKGIASREAIGDPHSIHKFSDLPRRFAGEEEQGIR